MILVFSSFFFGFFIILVFPFIILFFPIAHRFLSLTLFEMREHRVVTLATRAWRGATGSLGSHRPRTITSFVDAAKSTGSSPASVRGQSCSGTVGGACGWWRMQFRRGGVDVHSKQPLRWRTTEARSLLLPDAKPFSHFLTDTFGKEPGSCYLAIPNSLFLICACIPSIE